MKLSLVVPTLNRLDALQTCIASLRAYAPPFEHEIIVVDGGSTDGTAEWLLDQRDLVVLQHNRRRGCVKAFNDGFRISVGEYVAQLSDDVEVLDNCLEAAAELLDRDPTIGQVIIPHIENGWNRATVPMFSTDHGKYPFVAFGLTRRRLGEAVGWWGDYYHQQGDPELTIKIMKAGFKVATLDKYKIMHRPGPSEMRQYKPDKLLFWQRWHDWRPPE